MSKSRARLRAPVDNVELHAANRYDRLSSVRVGGSLRSGAGAWSGSISSGQALGSVKVKGSLVGTAANPVVISAFGQSAPTSSDLAIASILVKGRAELAHLQAGYRYLNLAENADAQIGTVTVLGDWISSSLAAGVVDGGNGFGNSLDVKISEAGDDPNLIAKIGAIVIGGQAIGSVDGGGHFGFVAERVASLTVGGTLIPLAGGPHNDDVLVGATTNLRVLEV